MQGDLSALHAYITYIRATSRNRALFEEVSDEVRPASSPRPALTPVQDVLPLVYNDTRWEGRKVMVERALRLRQGLTELYPREDLNRVVATFNAPADFLLAVFWDRLGIYDQVFQILHAMSKKSQAEAIQTKSR